MWSRLVGTVLNCAARVRTGAGGGGNGHQVRRRWPPGAGHTIVK